MKLCFLVTMLTIGLMPFLAVDSIKDHVVSHEEAMQKITFNNNSFENLSLGDSSEEVKQYEDISVSMKFKCKPLVGENPSEYFGDLDMTEDERRSMIDAGREYYSKVNEECLKEVDLSMFDNVYVGKYSPFINITILKKARSVTTYDDIVNLAYYDVVEFVDVDTFNTNENQIYASKTLSGINQASDESYGGDGIRIGVLELGLPDVSHSNFLATDIVCLDQPLCIETVDEHATKVCSVLAGVNGVARNASLYCAQLVGHPSNEVEWMLDNDVNVINCSYGDANPNGVYSNVSSYMDYVVYTYRITIVAAVGNEGEGSGYVGNPALGYNVIGVGAVGSEFGECFIFTSYLTNNNIMKPNICASGGMTLYPFGYISGTSFAAPMVTGIIAKLMQEKVLLRTMPELVLSILTSGATNVDGRNYGGNVFVQRGGYGIANYSYSRNALYRENYYNEETGKYYDVRRGYFDIDIERGARMRFAASWLAFADGNKNNSVLPRFAADVKSVDFGTQLMNRHMYYTNVQVMDGEIEVDGTIRFHSEMTYCPTSYKPYCVALSARFI